MTFCGGFADRLKGVASAFAVALTFNKPFRLKWHRNSYIEDYFDIEPSFLNFDGSSAIKYFINQRTELLNTCKKMELNVVANLTILSNSIDGVQGILENPVFKNGNLPKLFPGFDIESDQSPFIAAIMRFVIGKPNSKLMELYEECIGSHLGEGDLLKVGVQIRNGDRKLPNFKEDKFDLFETQLLEDFPSESDREKVIVFITGDSNERFISLIDKLRQNFRVVTSGETCQQLQFNHIDKTAGHWISEAKTYLDWYALTQMDRLYISRSGFGETAALISMVPTQHFTCASGEWKFRTFSFLRPFEETILDKCWHYDENE